MDGGRLYSFTNFNPSRARDTSHFIAHSARVDASVADSSSAYDQTNGTV